MKKIYLLSLLFLTSFLNAQITFDFESNVTGDITTNLQQTVSGNTLVVTDPSGGNLHYLQDNSLVGDPAYSVYGNILVSSFSSETKFELLDGSSFDLDSFEIASYLNFSLFPTITSSKGGVIDIFALTGDGIYTDISDSETIEATNIIKYPDAPKFTGITSFTIRENFIGYTDFVIDNIIISNIVAPSDVTLSNDVFEVANNQAKVFKANSNQINISGFTGTISVSIINLAGEVVYTTSIDSDGNSFLKTPTLATGIYLVNVVSATQNTTSKIHF